MSHESNAGPNLKESMESAFQYESNPADGTQSNGVTGPRIQK